MPNPTRAPALHRWLDRFFGSYYRHRPVNATFIGVHDHDHRLPDLSEHGVGDAVADMKALLTELGELDDEPLLPHESMDRRLAQGFLRLQLWEYESTHFHRGNPCWYTGEAIFGVMSLFLSDYAPLEQRLEAAVARTLAVPELLSQALGHLRSAPVPWTRRAVRECRAGVEFFTRGVAELDARTEGGGFREAAARAAQALEGFRVFLDTDLTARHDGGFACGEEAFSLHLREGHCLREDVEEVLRYAEDRLGEAEAHLRAHAADFGAGTPEEALAGLRRRHPGAEEYHRSFVDVWKRVRELALAHDLLSWPDFPIRFVQQPTWARGAAPHLYFLPYRSPAAYRRPAVHHYLVPPLDPTWSAEERTAFLESNNESVIRVNHVIHHGGIGHHVQNWHAFRAPSRVGRIAAVDCASRIAMLCGGTMAEGWACYATDLVGEFGGLTPLELYAQWHSRARMACRAIVDVRLHRGDLSLEGAQALYGERALMTPGAARAESVKNSMFPGAAVMYLLGTDAIRRLRDEMSRIEGGSFTLRGFHDRVLSYGSVPVSLIAEDMQRRAGGDP